jgi:signal transduction histidine kinase
MPDGAAAPAGALDAAERDALAADERLVRRVRWRLVLWSGGTTFLVLVVLATALYAAAARTLEARAVQQLERRADDTRGFLTGDRPNPQGPGLGFILGGGSSGTFAVLADDAGGLIGRRDFRVPNGIPVTAGIDAARTGGATLGLATVDGVPVRVRTERVDTRIGPLYIQVIGDRTTEQSTLDAILRVLVLGGLVVVAVAFGSGAVYANRALVPIRHSLAAQRLALRRQREFAADASHELRTPLTVIRSSLDHLRRHRDEPVRAVDGALDDIDAEVGQLTTLVEDLLLLARSDSGAVALERRPLDLGDVAAEAASSLAKPAGARDVRVVVDPEPAIVEGDAVRLRQLVTILVDNAIRHSPRGGEVRVAVRSGADGATLDVADQGSGLRPGDMPHVFERFWRAPGSPSGGTGLGLAIAKWIVDRHEGTIAVTNSHGGGAVFRVRLPAARPGST